MEDNGMQWDAYVSHEHIKRNSHCKCHTLQPAWSQRKRQFQQEVVRYMKRKFVSGNSEQLNNLFRQQHEIAMANNDSKTAYDNC